ncbi:hypothetical protein BM1_05543 [Bipolaris maydis]|nr:hypothetical protein BM1_05543 [Bipolaris maydis]
MLRPSLKSREAREEWIDPDRPSDGLSIVLDKLGDCGEPKVPNVEAGELIRDRLAQSQSELTIKRCDATVRH